MHQVNAVAAVVMAAGAGRRMGHQPKSLLRRDGEPLLLRQLRLLREAGVRDCVAVLGAHAPLLQAVLDGLPAAQQPLCVINPTPEPGPASSLRCGLLALEGDFAGFMVLLADQPLLQVGDVQALLQAWQQRPADKQLLLPEHAGQPGHPLVFSPLLRQILLQGPAGQGVRQWRQQHPQQVSTLVVTHGRYTTDVDSPEDVQQLAQVSGVCLSW